MFDGPRERGGVKHRVALNPQHARRWTNRGRRLVVEETERARIHGLRIVLPCERDSVPEREIALRPAEPEQNGAGVPIEFVHGPGIPRRDEQIPVRVDAHRIDVEVVERGARSRRHRAVTLTERHVIETVPLEDHPSRRDVELLDDAVRNIPILGPADRGQIVRDGVVHRDEGGVSIRDLELVRVCVEPVARLHRCYPR